VRRAPWIQPESHRIPERIRRDFTLIPKAFRVILQTSPTR
jgi:hypothetical protein